MNLTAPLRAWALEASPATSFQELAESSSPGVMYVGSTGKLLLEGRILGNIQQRAGMTWDLTGRQK